MSRPTDTPVEPDASQPQRPTRQRPTLNPTVKRRQVWEPDIRWAHPLEAAMWCYFLALVVDVPDFGIPPLLLALLGPVGAAVGAGRARRAFPEHEYGPELGASMRVVAITGSLAAAAWLVWACWTSPLRAVGWLAIITLWFGGWYWVLRSSAPKKAAQVIEEREEALIERATATWTDILKAANLPLRIVETRPTRAGYVIGVEPLDDAKPVSFATLQNATVDLTVKAAALLAREGVTVRAGDIRPEETEAAHVHLIHVCTKQILRESIPFEPFEEAPGTIADPLDFGLYEDGQEVVACFGGEQGGLNGKVVGATGSGKSRMANSVVGRVGECGDVLVGVIASSKLVPATYPWLKPWLEGRTDRPALDFAAGQNPKQVLLMMAAIYQIVRERNEKLSNEATHVPTPEAPAIVVLIEEAGDMATRTDTVMTHDGQQAGFSKLLHMIMKECRSAQVSVLPLNQTDLYGALGDYGPEIARNTPFRVCLKTLAPQDGPSVLPGLRASYSDTSRLRHNSMLVQPSIEDPRVMPAKAYNLGGDLIHPIAERNAGWRPELEPELVAELEEVWTGRWDAARLPELAAAARRDGLEWPVGQVGDEMDAALWELIDQEKAGQQPAEQAEAQPTADTSGVGEFPDAEAAVAELKEIANRPALTLPEPLRSVVALLREEQAPKDFISTRQLAILLGRVEADADDEELKVAAAKLGREMAAIDGEIRTEQRGRLMGYDVPALKTTAARIARGGAQ